MFKIVSLSAFILGCLAGFSLIFLPFFSHSEVKYLALWILFIVGYVGGSLIIKLQEIVDSDTILNISSSILILFGFLAGLVIFLYAMGWIPLKGGVFSLWLEFFLCIISSLIIKYSSRIRRWN